jgi:pimeloyl-ACP methyl ester carboxylesterase
MFVTSVDGISIYYEINGTGDPILLLHGFSNDHSIWHDTGWVDRLKQNYTVIAIDLRGCGKSDKPEKSESYSLDAHIADIQAVLSTCSIECPIIWGWSFGATLGLQYVKKNKIKAIVAAGTYFGPIFTKDYVDKRIQEAADDIQIARMLGLKEWPLLYPKDIKIPFLIYTGTNDGNVVVQIRKQESEIINAGGKVLILDGVDHYGLINNQIEIDKLVMPFIENK